MALLIALVMLRFRSPKLDHPFMSEDARPELGFWGWVIDHDWQIGATLCASPVIIALIIVTEVIR